MAENKQSEKESIQQMSGLVCPELNNKRLRNKKKQMKPGQNHMKQKIRPIPLHLQESVGKELQKLIKAGPFENVNNVDEDCCVSPVVITVKKRQIGELSTEQRKLK